MRLLISFLCRSVLAGLLLFASIGAGRAQGSPEADPAHDARREWHNLANGRTEFEVSDPALLPRQIALAIEQSGCRYKEDMQQLPIRFIRVEKQRFAIVFCRFTVTGSHRIFDLQNLQKPKPMAFPFFARNGGFGTTELPGVITWKKEAGVFEAEIGSDIACSGRTRHTYRLSSAEGLHGITFVIVRIQVKKDECRSEWLTIWEASPWPPWPERFP
jgi:hypothetical protein